MTTTGEALLFVYGTLLPGPWGAAMGRGERERLGRESIVLGAAVIAGRLVDLGPYPGLIGAAVTDDVVHGELLRLIDPAATLRWLDDYEGIGRGGPAGDEYVRERRAVRWIAGATMRLAGGSAVLPAVEVALKGQPADAMGGGEARTVAAWVYVYRRDVTGFPVIAGGRWLARP